MFFSVEYNIQILLWFFFNRKNRILFFVISVHPFIFCTAIQTYNLMWYLGYTTSSRKTVLKENCPRDLEHKEVKWKVTYVIMVLWLNGALADQKSIFSWWAWAGDEPTKLNFWWGNDARLNGVNPHSTGRACKLFTHKVVAGLKPPTLEVRSKCTNHQVKDSLGFCIQKISRKPP